MARPSHKHPTLELRATDCCTNREDAIAIAALYRSLIRLLYTEPQLNAEIDDVAWGFAVENKWRAQRYGIEASFASQEGPIPVSRFLDDVIDLVAVHAMQLQCLDDVLRCKQIVERGTSSDRQIEIFDTASRIAPQSEALQQVCAWIARTSLA
jgi:glutamate---cysteine ligase / carboxylate-amine ligase